jgi:MATE family multidrug resistance protein
VSTGQPTSESRLLFRIAAPMMVAQGGLVFMGVVDTLVVGRISAEDMAAVSLGNNAVMVVMGLGLGLIMGLETFVSQSMGQGDRAGALGWLQQSVWLALLVAAPLSLLSLAPILVFRWAEIDPAIRALADAYVWARLPGHVFGFAFTSYRSFLSASGRTRPIMNAVLVANLANVALDLGLAWGLELGAAGVGLATSVCWIVLLWVAVPAVRFGTGVAFRLRDPNNRPDPARLRRLVRIGLPIGLHFALEIGIFALVSVLVGRLGAVALAGHQIAMTMAALTFMLATGISIAATARVGHHIGARDAAAARRSGFLALGWGALLMGAGAVVFVGFGGPIANAFAPGDPEVARMGVVLLRLAAIFGISDGLQAVGAGVLRGLGDTAFTFWANMVGHWVIGLPVGLALGARMGAEGYWWGLAIGLSAVAVALVLRFAGQVSRARAVV